MYVTAVRFEAFKSLYDVTCSFDQFTVITGPNGAGKSNLVDGLNFLGEVYGDGLEFAVGRSGGYDNLAHRRTRRAKKPVTIGVDVKILRQDLMAIPRRYPWLRDLLKENPLDPAECLRFRHEFTVGTASQALVSDFEVRSDRFEMRDHRNRVLVAVSRNKDGILEVRRHRGKLNAYIKEILDPFYDVRFTDFLRERPQKSTQLVTENFTFGGVFAEVKRALGGTRVFQLSPYQCRTSGVPTPNAVLERHGENLPGAADHLVRNDARAWSRVQDAMRDIMPGLEEIDIAYTEDRRLALQFRERGVGRPWNTNEVSDGTMQSLALFIAIFDLRHPLLAIEEPENSIHPWILRRIVDLCQRGDSPKQIIMTSHSPVLLNYVNPNVVRLMTISNGRSSIRHLLDISPDLRESVTEGRLDLFDLYDSGVIDDAIPRGFANQDGDGGR